MIDSKLIELITKIPKAELHCHIDSIPPELLLRFAERNKVSLPFSDIEGAEAFYSFNTLDEFLEIWRVTMSVVRTEEDYADIALAFSKDASEQNIIYREGMFTYASAAHEDRNVPLDVVVNGFAAGIEQGKKQYGVDIRFIAEIDRTQSPERTLNFVKKLEKYRDKLPIVAVGLDCEEIGYPALSHKEAFKLAGALGFNRTSHCGEDAGSKSVWDSINNIKVNRIDHGVRAIEDPDLVKYLVENNILLTICPISNVLLGVYPSLDKHSIKELMDKGVKVCINSDDPAFLRKNLIENFTETTETFKLNEKDIISLVRNSFEYNFSGNEYLKEVDQWVEKWEKGEIS